MKNILYILIFLFSYSGYSQVGNNKIVVIPNIGSVAGGGATDGNGIFDITNDGSVVPSTFNVALTDNLNIDAGTLYIDGSSNEVGIGTAIPSSTLDVVGTMQYVDGNESDGFVLTSDASGNATWQLPSSLTTPDDIIEFSLSGSYTAGTNKDGLQVVQKSGTIIAIIISHGQRGNTGDNIMDINKHTPTLPLTTQRNATAGTTIYTTQANRPTIAGLSGSATDNAVVQASAPDVTTFSAGEFFTLDVDQRQNNAEDLKIQIFIKYDL